MTTWTQFWPFYHLSTSAWTFYRLKVDKMRHFATTSSCPCSHWMSKWEKFFDRFYFNIDSKRPAPSQCTPTFFSFENRVQNMGCKKQGQDYFCSSKRAEKIGLRQPYIFLKVADPKKISSRPDECRLTGLRTKIQQSAVSLVQGNKLMLTKLVQFPSFTNSVA